VSYGIEIFTDDYLVLSQYTCLTDGRTDRKATAIARSNRIRCALRTKHTLYTDRNWCNL